MNKAKSTIKNITEINGKGYQVRIKRLGHQHSSFFSFSLWEGRDNALSEAMHWRDLTIKYIDSIKRHRIKPNHTNKVRGVSRFIQQNKQGESILCYSVFWYRKGKRQTKIFSVGKIDEINMEKDSHVIQTAIHFRKSYEYSELNNLIFNYQLFKGWRNKVYYTNEFSFFCS